MSSDRGHLSGVWAGLDMAVEALWPGEHLMGACRAALVIAQLGAGASPEHLFSVLS